MTPRDAAQKYLDRGWVPVPIPIRTKRGGGGWNKRTLATAQASLNNDFGTKPQNIAILLGAPSNGLVDIDLDCNEAIDLAPEFLAVTRTFGRPSKVASHWIFGCRNVRSAKYPQPVEQGVTPPMLVELRSTGCLTVFPESVHESGEPIHWTDESVAIATIEASDLYKRCARLAVASLLMRRGMPRDEAIATAKADGEFLVDHPCMATIRKWLGGKAERTKPERKATGASRTEIDAAVEAYNREHPADWPASGGTCPACHHNDCFGTLCDNRSRWVCFSASHTAPGILANNCHHGDALDLAAHEAGISRVQMLVAAGYLHHDQGPSKDLGTEFITDLGIANRFVKRHGANVRYIPTLRQWFLWDDARWVRDETGKTMHFCAQIAREVTVSTAGGNVHVHNAARKQEQDSRIAGALRLAGVNPVVACRVADLDADPLLITVKNGTMDLRTGLLRRHERDDLITKLLPHEFNPSATCPRWETFLGAIMNGRVDLINFLHRWAGYCLTADVREHAILLLVGKGCNGKSVFVETLMFVLGAEFATPAAPGLLLAQKGERHPTEIFDLLGRRLVVANEVPKNTAFNEERVKSLAGGDTLKGRPMRGDFVTVNPTHKLTLCANHMPRVKDPSEAFWRRLRVVPFDVSFKGREDKTLSAALRAEAPGILARMVRECLRWQAEGLGEAIEVNEATKAYRQAEDLIALFLLDYQATGGGTVDVAGSTLYAAYKAWCETNGEKPMPNKSFAEDLERLGWVRHRKNTGNVWSHPSEASGGVEAGGASDPFRPYARAREEPQPADGSTCFHGSTDSGEDDPHPDAPGGDSDG